MIKKNIQDIVWSGLDNYIVVHNNRNKRNPSVSFETIEDYQEGHSITIKIKDFYNADNFSLVLEGGPENKSTATSFNTGHDAKNTILSLAEALKRNGSLFSNITVRGTEVIANIDSSRLYSITIDNIGIECSMDYFEVEDTPKYVLQYENAKTHDTFTVEKYSDDNDVYFNVTAPFENMAFHDAQSYYISLYSNVNDKYEYELENKLIHILPSTLHKFDKVNLEDYYNVAKLPFYEWPQPMSPLTNSFEREYRDGDYIVVSLLKQQYIKSEFVVYFYTPSGEYIGKNYYTAVNIKGLTSDVLALYQFPIDVAYIENRHGMSVGYFVVTQESTSMESGSLATYQSVKGIKYYYKPICGENHPLYFQNAIGGVDCFNFTGMIQSQSSVKSTVDVLLTSKRSDTEIETRMSSQNCTYYTYTVKCGKETAEWLREMAQSKWVFDNNQYSYIIDSMDIATNTRDASFDVTVKLHRSDQLLNI